MRLKRLELFGFKSFADRTVLEFDRKLTGIVGPNGCGKSNVVDAIRWTLGEQRPTSMRGSEMTDVIFKGSTSRPALSVAESTMVFDNSAGVIEERGAEVSITRRVYRDGEGEYLLDGERVRLKDVKDMLFNTGLGSRGYAVLEQGRIDAVLSANPLERRAIFEEAAGISRYRQRKHEAENKLKRVERDMERLDDVLRELTSRSRSLKIQAGKAERFLTARDSWRENATRYARHRASDLKNRLEDVRERIGAAEAKGVELRELRGGVEADVQQREAEQAALVAELDRTTARSAELGGELRALDERKAQLSARVSAWRRSAEEELEREAELGTKLEERSAELEALRTRAAELEEEAKAAEAELAACAGELATAQRELAEVTRTRDEQNEAVLALVHEKTAAENEVLRHERTLGPLGERLERAQQRSAETSEALESAREVLARTQEDVCQAEERSDALERRRADLDGEARALETRTAELSGKKNEGDLARTRIESRIESLLDRESEHERLETGARELLRFIEEAGQADDQADDRADDRAGAVAETPAEDGAFATPGAIPDGWPPAGENAEAPEPADERPPTDALAGLLADKLTTSTRFARALDVVLGDRAQALVVKDEEAAGRIVDWLKRGELGHARLVLPRGIGQCCPVDLSEVERLSGVEGALLRAVDVAPGYEELADALLCAVVIVSDVERAVDLVSRYPGLRCVTVEGDCVDAAGVSGGHREVVHGPIGRRASAAELGEEVLEIERANAGLEQELERLGERRGALENDTQAVLAELDEARQALADAKGAAESARVRMLDLEEAQRVHAGECEEIARERTACEEALAEARSRHAELLLRFEAENAYLEELVQSRRRIEGSREDLARREAERRVEATRLSGELASAKRRSEDLARGCEELEEDRTRARELAERHQGDAEDGERQFEEIDVRRGELMSARGEVSQTLEELRGRDREAREAIEGLRHKGDAVTRELEDEMSRLSETQLEAQRTELSREELLRRAEEELSFSEYDLLADFEAEEELVVEGALDELEEIVGGLKRELDKLGSVNLEAVEELEEVSERLTFLEEQRGDVLRAKTGLLGTLKTINEESERLFLDAFQEIRENFSRLFRQLFGGGRATIELAQDMPVLEAGIEISARPPGREMLPLGLLSGGQRTMTALGLLFAVFQSRPSPFCVLDEVDAALDDANVGRFLVLLDGFREGTQFVIVTHNKGTMSACDVLYGITMETRGVSRHVAVELSDVDDFVPDVQGNAEAAQEAREEAETVDEADEASADSREVDPDTGEPVVELVPEAASGGEASEPMVEPKGTHTEEEALGSAG